MLEEPMAGLLSNISLASNTRWGKTVVYLVWNVSVEEKSFITSSPGGCDFRNKISCLRTWALKM